MEAPGPFASDTNASGRGFTDATSRIAAQPPRFLEHYDPGGGGVHDPRGVCRGAGPDSRQTEGPFYPNKLPLDTDNDLLVINDGITPPSAR